MTSLLTGADLGVGWSHSNLAVPRSCGNGGAAKGGAGPWQAVLACQQQMSHVCLSHPAPPRTW